MAVAVAELFAFLIVVHVNFLILSMSNTVTFEKTENYVLKDRGSHDNQTDNPAKPYKVDDIAVTRPKFLESGYIDEDEDPL